MLYLDFLMSYWNLKKVENIKARLERPWILFSYKSLSNNFESFTSMTFKLQEVAHFGMFFRMMQTIYFIHVCAQ